MDLGAPGTNILSAAPLRDVRLAEGFESGAGAWVLDGGWAVSSAAASAGAHSLSDSPAGPYANGASAIARLAEPVDLSGGTACDVRFDLRIATAGPGDRLLVERSPDGGAWATAAEVTGSTGGHFAPVDADLSDLDGDPSVHLRLRLVTDGAGVAAGAEVDEVEVGCVVPGAGGTFAFRDGTSMAAPEVAGVAALMMTAAPEVGAARIRAALLAGADPLPALAGATATGGRLNAARALAAALVPLGYRPPGAPEPEPAPGSPPAAGPSPGLVVIPEEPRPLRTDGAERVAADRVAPRLLRLALGRAAGRRAVAVLRLAERTHVRITVQRRLSGRGPSRAPSRSAPARGRTGGAAP